MDKAWKRYAPAVCAGLGVLCLAGTVWAALYQDLSRLEIYNNGWNGTLAPVQGTLGQRTAVAAALIALAALALLLLRLEGIDNRTLLMMLLPVAAAMLVRSLMLEFMSGDYNRFLSHWVDHFRLNGGFAGIAEDLGDYNVPYLYILAAISYSSVPDLYLIKLVSILADVLLAWGGFRLVRILRGDREGDRAPLTAFILLLFLPTVVLNGALWGQCDAIYGALVLHALAAVLNGKNKTSVALLAVAFSFKLQTIFLVPLWGVLWLARRVKFRELLVFPLTYALTIVPALLLGKPLEDILSIYFDQMGEFPALVLNAPSVFQLLPSKIADHKDLVTRAGILAAFALALALLGVGLWLGRRMDNAAVMTAAVVLAIGVPFFLPHMHDRYFFLADVTTLCWACANWKRTPAAVLAAGASLASYMVYLRLKFNFVFTLFGTQYVMGLEALAMLTALLFSMGVLIWELSRFLNDGKPSERRENL